MSKNTLQLEGLQYRLKNEYSADMKLELLTCIPWLIGDPVAFDPLVSVLKAKVRQDRQVILFKSAWDKDYTARKCPGHKLAGMG